MIFIIIVFNYHYLSILIWSCPYPLEKSESCVMPRALLGRGLPSLVAGGSLGGDPEAEAEARCVGCDFEAGLYWEGVPREEKKRTRYRGGRGWQVISI